MNDYTFLNNLATLMAKGYTIEESLTLCSHMHHHSLIAEIKQRLSQGDDLTAILQTSDLPEDFLMFYRFFTLRYYVSDAILNALEIAETLKKAKERILKKMSYPMVLLLFMFVFSLFTTFFLFPQVDLLFQAFGARQSLLFNVLFMIIRLLPLLMLFVFVVAVILILNFLYALHFKRYMTIEWYLRIPFLKSYIQKYFTLKFALFFHELMKDHLDSNTTIRILNEHMTSSDMKIILYEIHEKMKEGQSFENIIRNFEYFDPLFVSLYEMYLHDPEHDNAIGTYIDFTYRRIEQMVDLFMKITVPAIYAFVAFFIIVVYIGIILPMMNIISEI